jgi:hypothetical protein
MILGAALGYVVFCLVFTMHAHTHGYYHAQLIPIVALAASPLCILVVSHVRQASPRYWWGPVAAIALLSSYAVVHEVRAQLNAPIRYERPAAARRIGRLLRHSRRVVFLAPFYGQPLEYYAEITGAHWPRSLTYYLYWRPGDRAFSVRERYDQLGFVPEYFVITAMDEYRKNHQDLREYLRNQCTPVALTTEYLIYGSCAKPRDQIDMQARPLTTRHPPA